MNDNEFFGATPELTTIQQWAHARFAASWAVFGAVLLRVAATTDPNVQLPGVIGGRASINLLAAFVSPSGGGKGISDKVARLVWPAPIIERPIGSGEGIAATFVPPKKEGEEPITRAIISVPEIDTMAGIASRQGSILLAQVKSFAMGEQLGQSNASAATTRIVAPHSYRGCMSVGAQPAHCGVLFDDTSGGTPQRFLWFLTIDPDMPGEVTAAPQPLNASLPLWAPGMDGVVEIGYGPDEIRTTIINAHLARQRGESEALDGHAMLTRLKVAATLAIMHQRSVVSDLDWELSQKVMEISDQTRDWVVTESQRVARQKVRERALSRAAGDEFYDQRLLERVKRSIEGMLERDGEQASSDLRRRLGKREKRDLFDQAVAELEHEGSIESVPGRDSGSRYRSGHGDQLGHPIKPQVNEGDQSGHGDHIQEHSHDHPSSTERSDNSSSELVSDDVGGLHLVHTEDKPTCAQWTRSHALELMAKGVDTIESPDWFAAGDDAGFKIDNLRRAVMESDLVSTAARTANSATFRLGAGGTSTVVSCPRWLDGWLRDRDWVPASDAYAAGDAAGYERTSVKAAAKRLNVERRGASIRTEWKHPATESKESA